VTAGRLRALGLLFLLSGAGALLAETVWLRWLRGLLGATAPAASATLLAFFAGHALGAVLAGRRAARWRRPVRAYALVETAAAAAVLAVPVLLRAGEGLLDAAYDGLRSSPAGLTALRFAVALVATLPAATLFGASLPAVGAAALGRGRRLGSAGTGLYALNLLGAAAGAAAGAFWLPERLGVWGTYGVAAILPALAALGAFALSRGERAARGGAAAGTRGGGVDGGGSVGDATSLALDLARRGPGAIAALSGFVTLAAQILAVQALGQVLNQSVYAFGTVLVVVLLSLALSAAATAAWVRRPGDAAARLGLAAAAAALLLAVFPAGFWWATGGLEFAGSGRPWPAYLFECLALAAATAGPPLLAGGLLFPLSLAWAAERAPEAPAGALLGGLLGANTAGAMAGALATPWLLLPALGTWGAFCVVGAACAVAALVLGDPSPRRRALRRGALAAGALAVAGGASPFAVPQVELAPGESVVAAEATPSGVVAVVERAGERLIRTDNHYSLGGTAEIRHQERQGHVPLLLHPTARSVAYAGSASGISAGALLAHPVERIRLVEIVPAVARAGARHFARANRGVHGDPRVEVVLDDAHNYLARTDERFDVVVADLFVPWRSGTGALFTREHFANVRERLEPGGLFCQWLPLYQLGGEELHVVLATFLDVFPTAALFRGDFYGRFPIAALVGFSGEPPRAAAVEQAVARLAAAGERDRWVTEPEGFWSLYAGALGPLRPTLADTPRNTRDRPVLEYVAARHHQGGRTGLARPYVGIAWQRFVDGVRTASLGGDPLFPDLDPAARRAAAGGAALQMAGALWVEGRREEASRAVTVAASLLPPRLLADAPADPTAAELWPDRPGRSPGESRR